MARLMAAWRISGSSSREAAGGEGGGGAVAGVAGDSGTAGVAATAVGGGEEAPEGRGS